MANTFIDQADNLAAVASVLISKDLRVASLVNRAFSREFDGKRGSSVNVRVPASLTANSRSLGAVSAYTTSDIVEATQAVALTKDYYERSAIADSDLTLSVQDAAQQVLLPMTVAIARAIEADVIALLHGITADATLSSVDLTDKVAVLDGMVDLRAKLRSMGAPESNLNAAVSVDVFAAILKAVGGASYDQGIGDVASGRVISVAGLSVVETNRLASGEAIGFARDSIALALKAPAAAEGNAASRNAMAEQGVPVRIVTAFDHTNGQHIALINTFGGVQTMTANVEGTQTVFAVRVQSA